jgi:hypothetical protein
MSFVITTVSPGAVVQVSDTRHSSLADRAVISNDLRKSLIVNGAEARFVLGWIGLATAGRHHTGEWLFRTLYEMNAMNRTPEEIVETLADLATTHFHLLSGSSGHKRCHFVLGGWDKSEPFVGVVSNFAVPDSLERGDSDLRYHFPSFYAGAVAAPKFQGWIGHFKNPRERDFVVDVSGDCEEAKLRPLLKGLKRLMRRRAGAARISAACRQIALEAGRHSKTIGKDLISVEMDCGGHGYCSHHSEEGTEQLLVPDMLTVQGGSTQATVSVRR